jgi:hypothetical protein
LHPSGVVAQQGVRRLREAHLVVVHLLDVLDQLVREVELARDDHEAVRMQHVHWGDHGGVQVQRVHHRPLDVGLIDVLDLVLDRRLPLASSSSEVVDAGGGRLVGEEAPVEEAPAEEAPAAAAAAAGAMGATGATGSMGATGLTALLEPDPPKKFKRVVTLLKLYNLYPTTQSQLNKNRRNQHATEH